MAVQPSAAPKRAPSAPSATSSAKRTPPRPTKIFVPPTKKQHFISIGYKEKLLFAKLLSVMIQAGIPLREALEAMHEQFTTRSMRIILQEAMKDLSDGQVLAYTLLKFPQAFDPFFSNVIMVGEESGTLPESLQYLGTQIEKTMDLRAKVRGALIYPLIVFFGAAGVGCYLAFFLLPQLLPLFVSLHIKLPLSTRILLAVTQWISSYWYWTIGLIAVACVLFLLLWRVNAVRYVGHRVLLSIPVLGNLFRTMQVTEFSRILGTLMTSGVNVVPALRITSNSVGNMVYIRAISKVADAVERGETIAGQLKLTPRLFSRTTTSMVGIGERTGKLAESFLSLADYSEREVDGMTKNLSTLIEPVVLLAVGVMVGFVALSIITPIYQLTQGITH